MRTSGLTHRAILRRRDVLAGLKILCWDWTKILIKLIDQNFAGPRPLLRWVGARRVVARTTPAWPQSSGNLHSIRWGSARRKRAPHGFDPACAQARRCPAGSGRRIAHRVS